MEKQDIKIFYGNKQDQIIGVFHQKNLYKFLKKEEQQIKYEKIRQTEIKKQTNLKNLEVETDHSKSKQIQGLIKLEVEKVLQFRTEIERGSRRSSAKILDQALIPSQSYCSHTHNYPKIMAEYLIKNNSENLNPKKYYEMRQFKYEIIIRAVNNNNNLIKKPQDKQLPSKRNSQTLGVILTATQIVFSSKLDRKDKLEQMVNLLKDQAKIYIKEV